MTVVVVDDAESALWRRVATLTVTDTDVRSVIPPMELAEIEPDEAVHLIVTAPAGGPDPDGARLGGVDLARAQSCLARIGNRSVDQVVLVSSALVYGAWADNPVPLSEAAPPRPNPDCAIAMDYLELERLVNAWALDRPDTRVAVLRRTLTVSADAEGIGWLERSLWHTATVRHGDADPPGQFLLIDDLARAIEHARRHGLDGIYNVAPDGWLAVAQQIELTGKSAGLRIPEAGAGPLARLRWRLQLTSTPPDVLPYTMHPWVVANDRLRATGWDATASNEEAFVAGSRPGWWSTLHGRRRQEVALAGLLASVAVGVGAAIGAVRHRQR